MAWTLFDITEEVTWLPRKTTIMETGTDSSARHIIHSFRDKASLEAWENSEDLHKQTEEVKQILYSLPTEGDWFGDMVYST